jgi:ribA/ribD-fused uncharacterized protein
MEIVSFSGSFRFLSNFYPASVRLDDLTYPTVEHAFQAAKTTEPRLRRAVRDVATPGIAKKMGRSLLLRPDWESMKLDVMLDLLRQKFGHSTLHDLILKTGEAKLIEGNTWGDRFWGQVDGEGTNHLGRLLMQVRGELHRKSQIKT